MTQTLFSFFVLIFLGVLFQIVKPVNISPETVRHSINTVIVKFFLPALCFKIIASSQIDTDTIFVPLTAISTLIVSYVIAFIIYTVIEKFIELEKKDKAVLMIGATFSNVTFLGLPLLTNLYGPGAAKYVLLYDLMATTPLFWFGATTVSAAYGSGNKPSLKDGLKNVMKLPPIWALIFGFCISLSGFTIPDIFMKTLEILSQPVIPLMIFSIGLALKKPNIKHTIITLPTLIIRLMIAPFLAFLFANIYGIEGIAFKSSVMEAAMPSMALLLVAASEYKLNQSLAAFVIVLTTAISFLTLPIVVYLLH